MDETITARSTSRQAGRGAALAGPGAWPVVQAVLSGVRHVGQAEPSVPAPCGSADGQESWREALVAALTELGYPGLDGVTVIAPKYPNSLHGVDDDDPLPDRTVKAPPGEAAKRSRRYFERR